MNFTVIIPTVDAIPGDYWTGQAAEAAASAVNQSIEPEVLISDQPTLARARNAGGQAAAGDWLIFLDADDRLAPGYIAAVHDAIMPRSERDLLVQPSTLGWDDTGRLDTEPHLIEPRAQGPRPLLAGNHLVIGTAVRRDLFLAAGGFRELAMFEDWDLWVRCWCAGATIIAAPDAVYMVQQRDGRNNQSTTLARQVVMQLRPQFAALARAANLL